MSANMKALYASETPGGAVLDGGGEQLEKLERGDVLVCHEHHNDNRKITHRDHRKFPHLVLRLIPGLGPAKVRWQSHPEETVYECLIDSSSMVTRPTAFAMCIILLHPYPRQAS
jgi:hypothetical protein